MTELQQAIEARVRKGTPIVRQFNAEIELPGADELIPAERTADGEDGIATRAKAPNGEQYHLRVTMSTQGVATDGGIIPVTAWKGLDEFARNGVLLWAHDYREPSIGRVVHCETRGKKLVGWVLFDDEDEFAAKIRSKYERKFLNAFSVGFIIKAWRTAWRDELTKDELKAGAQWVADEVRLLELSCVPVPADANALVESGRNTEDTNTRDGAPEAPAADATNTDDAAPAVDARDIQTGSTSDQDDAAPEVPASEAVAADAVVDPAGGNRTEGDASHDQIEARARIEALARLQALTLLRKSR